MERKQGRGNTKMVNYMVKIVYDIDEKKKDLFNEGLYL
jgi:hypothetical protein